MTASTSSSPHEAYSLLTHEMQRREDAIPEIQKEDQINTRLPNELLLLIFSFLPADNWYNVRLVCRHWKNLAYNSSLMPMEVYLRIFHTELKIRYIGESFWAKYEPYFHLIAKDPLYGDRETIVAKAKKMLAEVPVENNAGITLILEPKGFSLPLLREGCKTLNDGRKKLFRNFFDGVVNPEKKLRIGNDPVEKKQLLGLTTGIVKGTRSKTIARQKKNLQIIGCELASVKTLSLLAIATFLQSREKGKPIRLLGDPPGRWTYSRCIESKQKPWGLFNSCVGGFLPAGLDVCFYPNHRLDRIGVVALRKFL